MKKEILSHFRKCTEKVTERVIEKDKHRGEEIKKGADGSPTKKIDLKAESKAIEYFKENTDYSILSEEEGLVEQEGDGYIIMDPVDGTNNAVMDLPFSCISLAFTREDLSEVEVGYVKNFRTGDEYYALKGEGSYKNEEELDPKSSEEKTFCLYFSKYAVSETCEIARKARRIRSLGSAALSICKVAEGCFDAYYHRTVDEKKSLRITDIAASKLILSEVGGNIYDKEGKILNMKLDPAERKDVIAIYDEDIKEYVL